MFNWVLRVQIVNKTFFFLFWKKKDTAVLSDATLVDTLFGWLRRLVDYDVSNWIDVKLITRAFFKEANENVFFF